jgi:hypothetical protein
MGMNLVYYEFRRKPRKRRRRRRRRILLKRLIPFLLREKMAWRAAALFSASAIRKEEVGTLRRARWMYTHTRARSCVGMKTVGEGSAVASSFFKLSSSIISRGVSRARVTLAVETSPFPLTADTWQIGFVGSQKRQQWLDGINCGRSSLSLSAISFFISG